MLINIVGWYGERNAGDEAFRLVFQEAFSGHELQFSQRPNPLADRTVYGGGGVMGGQYFMGLVNAAWAAGVDIPLSGPGWEQLKAQPFKKLLVRSREYAALGAEQGLPAEYMPDLAFAIKPPKLQRRSGRIGVALTEELAPHHYEVVAKVLDRLLERRGAEVVFLPMFAGAAGPDAGVHARVQDLMRTKARVHSTEAQHTPMSALRAISSMSLMISMRFHGSVFAAMTGTPFLSLAHKGKHSIFCEQERLKPLFLELSELTSYRLLDQAETIAGDRLLPAKLWRIAWRNRREVRGRLAALRRELELA